MSERILFVTGKLAKRSLIRTLESMGECGFEWDILEPGATVAALITGDMLLRRLPDLADYDRVLLPGRCRGDLAILQQRFGVRFERGPEELKDLPRFFGTSGSERSIDKTDIKIFAEIVDAPNLTIDETIARAERYRADGADVIDLGCLPDVPFAHLEHSVAALSEAGYAVSIDSLDRDELRRGIDAGADYCFSLSESSLELLDGNTCVPVLIGEDPRDMDSLARAIDRISSDGRPFYADPIIDPIHYGFTDSLVRYHELRTRFPDIEIMLGIGNLSELTHADSLGVNAVLMGVASELNITAVLTTEVSGHCRTVVREIDRLRRVMYAAREDNTPPRHLDERLMVLHDRHPFPYTPEEIEQFAADVRDPNFRIQVSEAGIHIYNRDGLRVSDDPYELFPVLKVDDDAPHAFYLGLELAKAQIAWQLGKRYEQDEQLDWGVIRPEVESSKDTFAETKSTYKARRRKKTR